MADRRRLFGSAAVLLLLVLACLLGPMVLPNAYDRVFRDHVLAPPSFVAHPTAAEARSAAADVARALGLSADVVAQDAGTLTVRLAAGAPLDARVLRYFARSDAFGPGRIVDAAADGRGLTLALPLASHRFLLGTDANGRDLLARVLVGGRVSLAVGALASLVALGFGTAWGAVAGFAGGRVDGIMMRIVDAIYALPFIFFVIVLVTVFGRNVALIFVAIGAVEWLDVARLVRGQTLSLRERDYVLAARALGVAPAAILVRHVVPNALPPVLAFLALLVPRVILAESFVSFLGLGVQEPLTSWGILIADGARDIQSALTLLLAPALALAVTLVAFNMLGDAARRLFAGSR